MSGQVEIKYVGGPADGRRMAVPGDTTDPPHTITLRQAPSRQQLLHAAAQDPHAPVPARTLTYRRAAARSADGPLWLYRYDPDPKEQ